MTLAQTIKAHVRHPDVTANGVAFEWGYAGPDGAWFRLIREPHHTDADIAEAKRLLRNDRDVVYLNVDLDHEVRP